MLAPFPMLRPLSRPLFVPALTGGYSAAVLADSPVAYWRLGEASGTTAADASGNGYAGTYSGGVTLGQTGLVSGGNTAALFDASTGAATFSGIPDLTNNWTVECWLKRASTGTPDAIYSRWASSGSQRQLYIYLWTDGKIQVDIPFVAAILRGNTSVADNAAHHVAVTRSGNTWTIYVDGSSDATTTSAAAQEANSTVEVGHSSPAATGKSFNGTLDEVAIYSTALSSTRISAHYAAR